MKLKNTIKIIELVLIAVLLSNLAYSLGISPAEKALHYTPGEEQTFELTVINNEHARMSLNVYSLGELAEFITIEPKEVVFDEGEAEKKVNVTIKAPDNLDPGERTAKVKISETVPNVKVGESYVNVKLEVASKITIDVPYPEKYIIARLDVNATPEKDIIINLTVNNLGTKDIGNIKANLGIYEGDKLIAETKTNGVRLGRREGYTFSQNINLNWLKEGVYTLKTLISYDDNYAELGKDFLIGEEKIEIKDYTKYFVQGKVNKFDVEVENKWNRKIKNAFAQIFIEGFDAIKSVSYDLEPWQNKVIISYWDTSDINIGSYASNITLHHNDKVDYKEGIVHVIDESELGRISQESPLGFLNNKWVIYVIILFGFITLININWYILARKKKVTSRKKKGDDSD